MDYRELVASYPDGWVQAMGLVITRATLDEVCCEWEVQELHRQGYGIVHGGVYCGVIETLASIGAHLNAMQQGQRTVGLENHTSFVRAVKEGRLLGSARPIHRGRTTHVWEGWIHDVDGKLVARGTVRLLVLPEDAVGR
jgi:1,4-dihydroxy-2-naphthoyl-CoA hydrolase